MNGAQDKLERFCMEPFDCVEGENSPWERYSGRRASSRGRGARQVSAAAGSAATLEISIAQAPFLITTRTHLTEREG